MASNKVTSDESRHLSEEDTRNQPVPDPRKKHTKRLFSNRSIISDNTDSSDQHGEHGENTLEEGEYSASKRQRPSNWPLAHSSPNVGSSSRGPRPKKGSRRASHHRRSSSARASKFVEGSMNDRASQVPPATYLGYEDLRERYENENDGSQSKKTAQSKRFTFTQTHTQSTAPSSTADGSRQSGIFRFGKSIAATFNPSNWKLWSKETKPEDSYEAEQQRIMNERQEKAQKMYKELKESGYFQDGAHSGILQRTAEANEVSDVKHDSGVDFGTRSSTRGYKSMTNAEKRMGRIFQEPSTMTDTSRTNTPKSFVSPTSLSPRKSFQFKKPSLQNIRKSFDFSSTAHDSGGNDTPRLKSIPSRKDLQKQQKLVQRVSNLESKLEAARRQLSESLAESTPIDRGRIGRGRPRFVPGGLSTLPSERLLSGYVSNDGEESAYEGDVTLATEYAPDFDEIGRAVTSLDPQTDPIGTRSAAVSGNANTMRASVSDYQELPTDPRVRRSISALPLDKPLPQLATSPEGTSVLQKKQSNYIERQDTLLGNGLEEEDVFNEPAEQDRSERIRPNDADVPRPSIEREVPSKKFRKSLPKKRKSISQGLADDSGSYKPPPSQQDESEDEVTVVAKKQTPVKKKARKSGASIVRPATPELDEIVVKIPEQSAQRPPSSKKSSNAALRRRSSKFLRPSSPVHQSSSPPPSSSFAGIAHIHSHIVISSERTASRSVLHSQDDTYSAVSSPSQDIPPMPQVPRQILLATGEVIDTDALSKENHTPVSMRRNRVDGQSKQSFEWDRDVF